MALAGRCPLGAVSMVVRPDALAATIAFYDMNGMRLTLTNDEVYDLVMDVASGRLDDVPAIAHVLQSSTQDR
jgi:prophage maintenance system killer protein